MVIYVALVLLLQPDAATLYRYHLSASQLKLLSLTIVVPSLIIWFAIFYGYIHVGKYTDKIKNTRDGDGFKYLSWGILTLAIGMPITTIISRLLTYSTSQHWLPQATTTIITTHLTVVYTLIAFIFLLIGAKRLFGTIKNAYMKSSHMIAVLIVLIIIGMPYIFATLSNPSRTVLTPPSTTATYAMTDPWIVTTIIVPYLAIWALGFYTTLYLYAYFQNVRGKLYKKSLFKLNIGFFLVILSLIFLQFITAASTTISGWGLGALLALVYLLLLVISIGYIYVAFGAKGLAKLEDVT
jgi:hypothetical protein